MKEEIIQHLVEQQRQVIKDLQTEIKDRQKAADIDEDDTIDDDDFAQQEVNKDFVRRIRDQVDVAMDDLATLKTYVHRKSEQLEPGALIDTENFYILVGVSVQNDTYNDKKVICMSEEAPAYQANEGKKKGDTLSLGNNEVKIKDIL